MINQRILSEKSLPDSTRVKVVSEFLKAGIPLSKTDNLRGLLEAGGYSLSFILDQELDSLKHQIAGKPISITFDGTTHSICGCGLVC